MIMPLGLVTRGVVSGLCLVFAKYCYDRMEEKQGFKAAAYRNWTSDSALGHTEHPQASTVAIDVQAASSALSATAVAETEAPSKDRADARAEVFAADDIHPAAAEVLSGEAADTVAPDSQAPVVEPHKGTTRKKIDDNQRVEQALASNDLSSMDTLLADICDPVLRNRLLNRLVTSHYRLRSSDAKHRAAFYHAGYLQIEEASSILDGIKEIGRSRPEHIEAFKLMAIALNEEGRQDAAIAVCEIALSLGLQDGTKTGFEGRITRLQKSQMRVSVVDPEKLIH